MVCKIKRQLSEISGMWDNSGDGIDDKDKVSSRAIFISILIIIVSYGDEGDVATAFTLARILSNIPASRGGPTSLVTFDIHALQASGAPDSDNIAIAFPDDGAWKRFHKQLQHFPTIICAKVREGDQRIVRIKEGNPQGRHAVIVDDLVQSGGTLVECQGYFGFASQRTRGEPSLEIKGFIRKSGIYSVKKQREGGRMP
uniref:Phosphoribosyltransferase domain-containing protein n=1 Tax=Salix viminalis TaxID=40686 RepID=A0A6N2LDZ4_SALVM